MKLRVRLKRHSVLANVYCRADEGVTAAQGRLAEAQAERRRTLAALAVTIGSDVATARLLGLSDREVRSARRSVGNRAARQLANEVLHQRVGDGGVLPAESEPVASTPPLVPPEPAFEQDPWAMTWLPSEDALLLRAWPAPAQIHDLAQQLEKPPEAVLARLLDLSAQSASPAQEPAQDAAYEPARDPGHEPAPSPGPGSALTRPGQGRHRRLHVVHPEPTEVFAASPSSYTMYYPTGT